MSTDEVPVKKGVLKEEPRGKNELATERGLVSPEKAGKCNHGDARKESHEQSELKNVREQGTF